MNSGVVNGSGHIVGDHVTHGRNLYGNCTGAGYSQGQGLIVQTSVTQDNFLGSGKRISFFLWSERSLGSPVFLWCALFLESLFGEGTG